MKNTAVNLGAGGFVSYFDDGGASVILGSDLQNNQDVGTRYADGGEVTDQNVQRFKEFLKNVGMNKLYEIANLKGFRLPTGIGVDSAADVITNELLSRANIPVQKRGDMITLQKQLPKGINLELDLNPEQKYGYINVSGEFKADGGVVNSVGIGRLSRSEEPDYNEQGVGAFLADQFRSIVSDEERGSADEIRTSGRYNSKNRDVYYPEGGPTFFETLATEYGYPDNINPLAGSNRMDVPRDDLPKAQELEDTRAHMLASALTASEYGPKTAESVGNLKEFTDSPFTSLLGDSSHTIMDKRNNAVGISLFRKAGINATKAQLTESVDDLIFAQLNVILGRKLEEQEAPRGKPNWRKNFRSPEKGPDVYFPREESGRFSPDPLY